MLKHRKSKAQNEAAVKTCVAQEETRRRQEIARFVYDIWTLNGAEICGLADPVLVDGRLDILSSYVIEYYSDGNYDDCNSDHTVLATAATMDSVDATNLSYDNFCSEYMYRNIPVVIKGLSDTWSCCIDWVREDPATGQLVPNLSHIVQFYGNDIVTVHAQSIEGFQYPQQRPETSCTHNMTVADYVTWWNEHQTQQNSEELLAETLMYLKDWKFVTSHPNADIYRCPHFFSDDWLNDAKNSSYKFIYLGRKGTVTALHTDVLRSFSWSTNIVGTKLWYFVAPQHSHLLYDCFGTKLAYHLHADIEKNGRSETGHHLNDYMSVLFPGLQYARKHAFSMLQLRGDTIFVPTNWFHTVENIHDTLSINHNWLNGANILKCWEHVESKVRYSRVNANSSSDKKIASISDASNVNSTIENIDDDVLLVWEVIEKKAKNCINLHGVHYSPKEKRELLDILFVVDNIQSLYKGRDLSTIAAHEIEKIEELRLTLAQILQ